MRCHSERKAEVHPARVMLYGGIQELLDLREGDNFVHFTENLALPHAEYGAVQKNVLATAEFRVKAGSHFEQGPNSAPDFGVASAGHGDSSQDLQEGALAGTISPDDAEHV